MRNLKSMNRFFSLLLAVIMVMSVAVVPVSAVAEEDTYVLDRGVSDGTYYQYQSLYQVYYNFNGKLGYVTPVQVYKMQRVEGTNRVGEVILTYCTDINVSALANADYRRLNLEDSPYSANAAGQIRAILTHGFYLKYIADESDAAHQARVDEKLAYLREKSGVTDLTIGEALSATQAAIWQSAHGSALEFTSFLLKILNPIESKNVKYYEMCGAELTNGHIEFGSSQYLPSAACEERINGRIKAVYDYLLRLEPIAATDKAVSSSSFVKLQNPVITENSDGSSDISVTVTVDVDMANGDNLTLRARLNDTYYQDVTLNGGRENVTVTIKNVPDDLVDGDVKLSISGEQTVSGYFYFDAVGDRTGTGASQSMVGYSSSRLPVYAEVTAKENRVLNIQKTTVSKTPLEGIVFDIFPVATMEEYQNGTVTLPDNPADYNHPTLAEYTLITDANGKASLDLTHHGLPDGIYLVEERNHPSIVKPLAPFFVMVPHYDDESGGYLYTVTIKAKNEVKATVEVKIEKDVISLGNNSASVDAYTPHTWIIGASIPEDIASGKSYVITDTLDSRLDYLGITEVVLEKTDGTDVYELVADTDYALTETDDSFSIALTATGRNQIATKIGSNGYNNHMLRVYFNAQINATAEMGAEIPNEANVKYTNNLNVEYNKDSDVPVVYTGGINLLKVDATDNKTLAGASFEVYRPATAEEVNANGDNLETLSNVAGNVIQVSFYDNPELTGEKVTSVTSGADGKIAIYGLAHGKYYLVETKAPDGYTPMAAPLELTIDADSHTDAETITVENKIGTLLPSTGGVGTTVFTVSGIVLICAACLFLYMNKRKLIET